VPLPVPKASIMGQTSWSLCQKLCHEVDYYATTVFINIAVNLYNAYANLYEYKNIMQLLLHRNLISCNFMEICVYFRILFDFKYINQCTNQRTVK